jgi:uncharacterized lipoprotein YajG
MKRYVAIVVGLFALAACAMPNTTVRTTDTRPSLAFEGAPDGSVLYLDGQRIGDPNQYDGQPNILTVEPGTHLVVVKGADGAPLFERKVYVESELKTLKVH